MSLSGPQFPYYKMTSAVFFKLLKKNLAVNVAIPKPADGAGGIFWNEPTDQNCLLVYGQSGKPQAG